LAPSIPSACRRITALVVLTVLMLACAPATGARAATVVSLTFDDGTVSQLNASNQLAARGMRGTFFINSGNIDSPDNSYFMNWSQLASVAASGHEIAGHTLKDLNLVNDPSFSNDAERKAAICNDRAALMAHGYNPVSFAYPHGAYNAQVISLVQQCGYASARTAGGLDEPGFPPIENIPPANPYVLRTNQPHDGPATLGELRGYLDRAGGTGWVIFMFHDICDSPCTGMDPNGAVSPMVFGQFLGDLLARGTVVLPVRDVILPPPPPPPPPQAPKVTADKVTAFASLKAPKRQDIDKLYVTAAMIEPGTLSASATVNVPGASRVFKFKRASKGVTANKRVKLRLRLSKKNLRKAKRALRRGKHLKANIRVTARDNAGNSRIAKRTVRLRR
jgi:peptidoglycan/xylan/chitin deacetylase (PgdA/CDA1 family)